jgi:hypothetical protein
MEPNLASVVRDWHDFYGLVGTASAPLVGLMFVAASVGANIFSASHQQPMKAYLTPTVAHFSSLLFICILFLIPTQTWLSLSMTLGGLGVTRIAYSLRQWIRVFFTLHPPLPHRSGRSHLLCLRSRPRLFASRRFRRCVIRTPVVECRAGGRRAYCSAVGWNQKCLGYDRLDHHAFPPEADVTVDAQRRAADYGTQRAGEDAWLTLAFRRAVRGFPGFGPH